MAITKEYLDFLEEDDSETPNKDTILDPPKGKQLQEMSIDYYQSLIKKKGFVSVNKALVNLEVFNKSKNPELSGWAQSTRRSLDEWYSLKFGKVSRASVDPRQCSNCPEK